METTNLLLSADLPLHVYLLVSRGLSIPEHNGIQSRKSRTNCAVSLSVIREVIVSTNLFTNRFIYLFTVAYSLGEGPVAFQYSAEVFPTIQREQGMAWAVCINNTFAGILSLTFPRMVGVMTHTGAFGFYAGLNLIAWGMIFCFVRETKQLTLEEIDQVFSIPTSQFLSYEARVRVPYFFKRHFFRQKIEAPPAIIERQAIADKANYA